MIKFSLQCHKGHAFESWFNSSSVYEKMAKRGQIDCPTCGSAKVTKALMAPSVIAGKQKRMRVEPAAESARPAPTTREASKQMMMQRELMAAMRKIRAEVEAKAEYVGPKFAEEARKIHYEETPARGIYGEASSEEVKALHEEGVECYPLPVLPEDRN
jgi:hypothetical protein